MPCREWFEKQPRSYQERVLPSAVRARVSVEAGVSFGWHDIVGDAGRTVSIEHFGASADYQTIFREFGLTTDAVVKAARESIKAASAPVSAPGITETNPRKRESGSDTDVSAAARRQPAKKSATSKGK
jgi:transketolase